METDALAVAADFNPMAPCMAIDPYPHYRRLRETEPVHLSGMGFWVLTRYADVMDVLADNDRFIHHYETTQRARLGDAVADNPYFDFFRRMVFILDDEPHRRLRRFFLRSLTRARLAALTPEIEMIASMLADGLERQGAVDLVADFCLPLPTAIIGELLGVPRCDQLALAAKARHLNPVLEFLPMDAPTLALANEATLDLARYFKEAMDERRRNPRQDLLTAMVDASRTEPEVSEADWIANAILMYVAGYETTAGGTSLALLALHRNPGQLGLLQADLPGLIDAAVEECLRYDSPGQATARFVARDAVIGGKQIPGGSIVLAYLGAANRDPEAFERPEDFDISLKRDRRIASFGGGGHLCLGHMLARLELSIALRTLIGRFPGLRLDTVPPFRKTALMRGAAELRATM